MMFTPSFLNYVREHKTHSISFLTSLLEFHETTFTRIFLDTPSQYSMLPRLIFTQHGTGHITEENLRISHI
jgi:hypothetical protein